MADLEREGQVLLLWVRITLLYNFSLSKLVTGPQSENMSVLSTHLFILYAFISWITLYVPRLLDRGAYLSVAIGKLLKKRASL
jgi:uncharacterized membrane protein YhaH (DUF805 family)